MIPSPATLTARFGRDLDLTRQLIERAPEPSLTWRPHPRSFTLAALATHLARLPHWGALILKESSYDLATSAAGPRPPEDTRADILALFDRHVGEFMGALGAASDADLASRWVLRHGASELESLPRAEALDRYVLHHLIHHRGQLTVYLRLLDVPLIALYGPTADQKTP